MKFALRTVREYKERWIGVEESNLHNDIALRIAQMEHDKDYKETHENIDANELEKHVEEAFILKEGEEAMDDDLKTMM